MLQYINCHKIHVQAPQKWSDYQSLENHLKCPQSAIFSFLRQIEPKHCQNHTTWCLEHNTTPRDVHWQNTNCTVVADFELYNKKPPYCTHYFLAEDSWSPSRHKIAECLSQIWIHLKTHNEICVMYHLRNDRAYHHHTHETSQASAHNVSSVTDFEQCFQLTRIHSSHRLNHYGHYELHSDIQGECSLTARIVGDSGRKHPVCVAMTKSLMAGKRYQQTLQCILLHFLAYTDYLSLC